MSLWPSYTTLGVLVPPWFFTSCLKCKTDSLETGCQSTLYTVSGFLSTSVRSQLVSAVPVPGTGIFNWLTTIKIIWYTFSLWYWPWWNELTTDLRERYKTALPDTLIPNIVLHAYAFSCRKRCSIIFCSVQCSNSAWSSYHRIECQDLDVIVNVSTMYTISLLVGHFENEVPS